MLFLLHLELALNDDSSTMKIFHCPHFLILFGIFLLSFPKLCSLDHRGTAQLLTDQLTSYSQCQEPAVTITNIQVLL